MAERPFAQVMALIDTLGRSMSLTQYVAFLDELHEEIGMRHDAAQNDADKAENGAVEPGEEDDAAEIDLS